MHKSLYPGDDVDRLCDSRKEGGRGLANIEDSVDALMQRLEDFIKNCRRRFITVIRNNIVNTSINRTRITMKQEVPVV